MPTHPRFLTALAVFTILGIGIVLYQCRFVSTTALEPTKPPPPPPPPPVQSLREDLMLHGWKSRAAKVVADLYAPWLSELAKEKPADAEKQRTLLRGLGKQTELMTFMADHPETAGLLAGADNPQRIAHTLSSAGKNYDLIAGLYVLHADPEDAALLAEALDRHRSLICRLIHCGMFGAQLPFLFQRKGEADAEYDRWLAEELQARIGFPDEERTTFQMFLLDQGPLIRQRLRTDAHFRSVFRSELWPKLARVADAGGNWLQYAAEPHIWDLLELPAGEQLLRKRGVLPILLLFEKGCYPSELHCRIIRALLDDDQLLLQALVKFRPEPLFRKLLLRRLPQPVLAAALMRLFRAGTNYSQALVLFNGLSAAALAEEVGPPPDGIQTWVPLYETYYLGKKIYQGRPTSTMDVILAGTDVISFLLPQMKIGSTLGKEAASKSLKVSLVKKGTIFFQKQLVRQAGKAGARIGAEQATAIAARLGEKGFADEAIQYCIASALSRAQTPLREVLRRATTFEVTGPVRVLFAYSGLSRSTFRRLTGLEARLFMRHDAQVFLVLNESVLGTAASHIKNKLNEKIADKAADVVVGRAEQRRAWQQNVAAWWLLNAGRFVVEDHAEPRDK